MSHPLLIFSQSDYLIQFADTNSHTEWQTVQSQINQLIWINTVCKDSAYPGSVGPGLTFYECHQPMSSLIFSENQKKTKKKQYNVLLLFVAGILSVNKVFFTFPFPLTLRTMNLKISRQYYTEQYIFCITTIKVFYQISPCLPMLEDRFLHNTTQISTDFVSNFCIADNTNTNQLYFVYFLLHCAL